MIEVLLVAVGLTTAPPPPPPQPFNNADFALPEARLQRSKEADGVLLNGTHL